MSDAPAVSAHISDRRISQAFAASLSGRASDLIDIALAVYRYDRVVLRPRGRGTTFGASHQRTIDAEVAVRDLAFWRESEVESCLAGALAWITGDRWSFTFTRYRGDRRRAEAEQHLFATPLESGGAINLFSGGLDALAGAAVVNAQSRPSALLAVGTNPRQIRCQLSLFQELRHRQPGLVAVNVSASLEGATRITQERSQRSRPFLFLCIAAAAAEAAHASTINMCENGIGAMNLPYSARQIGVDTSRAAHPETLHRMTQLIRRVLERDVEVGNPLFAMTKAEACRQLPAEWLALVPLTVSCDIGFTDRRSAQLCGRCASCVLRREALHAAGLANLDGKDDYRFDLLRGDPGGVALRAMQAQVERLQPALTDWRRLVAAAPEVEAVVAGLLKSGSARTESEARATVQHLLAVYVSEWRYFPSRLRALAALPPAPVALAKAG